jgi:metal-responsive CopG/Arc/MetJ family transcriptional regulator
MDHSVKQEIITFKADASLLAAMKGMRNRSEFIRSAILAALDSVCPLCGGSGILTPRQHEHWRTFAARHSIEECQDCHETHLVCSHESPAGTPARGACDTA